MGKRRTGLKVQVHIHRAHPDSPGCRQWLVLRRPPDRGEIWQPVTGHVKPGETLEQCAAREVAEETGLRALGEVLAVGRFDFLTERGVMMDETVFAQESDATAEPRPTREHDAWEWLPMAEARARLHHESNRRGLDMARAAVVGGERGVK